MTEAELSISKLANGVMMAFWNEDRSGKLFYKFIAKLCGLTRLPAFCIEDKYKPYIVTKEEYEKIKERFQVMKRYIDPTYLKRDLLVADILGDDRTLEAIIDDVPTADVREVIHANWIEGEVDGRVCINCSNCGSIIPTDTQVDYLSLDDNKYCYWCGAIMGK